MGARASRLNQTGFVNCLFGSSAEVPPVAAALAVDSSQPIQMASEEFEGCHGVCVLCSVQVVCLRR